MNITLTRDAFNTIMGSCKNIKPFKDPNQPFEAWIDCSNGTATAVIVNGVSVFTCEVPCEQPSNEGVIPIPILGQAPKDEPIIHIAYEDGKTLVWSEKRNEEYILEPSGNLPKIVKRAMSVENPVKSIYFNASLLIAALTAVKKASGNEHVQVTFCEDWRKGAFIHGYNAEAVVLPVRKKP